MKIKMGHRIVFFVFLVAIILIGVWLIFLNTSHKPITMLGEGFTDILVTDNESAFSALESVSNEIGITDVMNEFTLKKTLSTDNVTNYCFLQKHSGIPVSGRSIRFLVDQNGIVKLLSSNYINLDVISTEAKIEETNVKANLEIELAEENSCSTDKIKLNYEGLEIYSFANKIELAYKYYYYFSDASLSTFEIFCSANDGGMISKASTKRDLDVTAFFPGSDAVQKISVEYLDPDYFMKDNSRQIFGIYSHTNLDYIKWHKTNERPAVSDIDAMAYLAYSFDYFNTKYGFTGRKSIFLTELFSQASTGTCKINDETANLFILSDTLVPNISKHIDVVAHEYTHSVTDQIIPDGFFYNNGVGQSAAISEAYSDIMGILIEAENKQTLPDWIVAEGTLKSRNISDPSVDQITKWSQYYDGLDCHQASTLISRIAYQMQIGTDDPVYGYKYYNTAVLNTNILSKLWVNSLYSLNSTATFQDCRVAVETQAKMMYERGEINYAQLRGVVLAFDTSGIPKSNIIILPTPTSNISTSTTNVPSPTQVSSQNSIQTSSTTTTSTINNETSDQLSSGDKVIGNGGEIVQKGDWVYYFLNGLNKMKLDGTDKILISEDSGYCINVVGNSIYYLNGVTVNDKLKYSINKINQDGSELTCVMSIDCNWIPKMYIVGDWIYFLTFVGDRQDLEKSILYKLKTDGTELIEIPSSGISDFQIQNEWIYYTSETGNMLFRMMVDGSKNEKICDDEAYNIISTESQIFYCNALDKSNIYRIDSDGIKKFQITDQLCFDISVCTDWIYYTVSDYKNDFFQLFKINIDGTGKSKITEIPLGTGLLCVLGDWVYLGETDYNSGIVGEVKYSLLRIKTDGSAKEEIGSKFYPSEESIDGG